MREEIYNHYEARYNNSDQDDSLYLCYCGYENCPPGHDCPSHIRNSYLIHYIISGTCYLSLNGEVYTASAGDYFIIPPNKLVAYHASNQPISYYWFAFSGRKADEVYKELLKESPVIPAHNGEKTISLINSCIKELKKPIPNQYKLKGNLYNLLALFEPEHDIAMSESKNSDMLLEKALAYIHHNYMSPTKGLSVQDIAKYLGMDRTAFSKFFKRRVGITAIEYIGNCQLDKALQLIKTTSLPFKEISDISGICDPYYFTKLVKQRTGLTPSEYRKKYRKAQDNGK